MSSNEVNGNLTELARQLKEKLSQPGLDKLAPALVTAWGEVGEGVTKDANNPHIGNDYATLGAILRVVKPVLAKNGLAILQFAGRLSDDGKSIRLPFLILHSSGQSIQGESEMPCSGPARKDGSQMPVTAQTVGSAITYGRRYQLFALFGLAPADDDGNEASGRTETEDSADLDARRNAWKQRLAECETLEAVDSLRQELEQIGTEELVKDYADKRKAIRKAKKS